MALSKTDERTYHRHADWHKSLSDLKAVRTPKVFDPKAPKAAKPQPKPRAKAPAQALPADVKAVLMQVTATAVNQKVVARELAVSVAAVSLLLADKYTGDLVVMAQRIRGCYMGAVVRCPVYGTLAKNKCLEFQALPAAYTNPLRSMLAQRCPTCPNHRRANPKTTPTTTPKEFA